jgi:hypothetical protein
MTASKHIHLLEKEMYPGMAPDLIGNLLMITSSAVIGPLKEFQNIRENPRWQDNLKSHPGEKEGTDRTRLSYLLYEVTEN